MSTPELSREERHRRRIERDKALGDDRVAQVTVDRVVPTVAGLLLVIKGDPL
ncbi:MAG: hypothetical protein WBG92_03000 [Thiohalocapsa sp.]